MIAATAWLSAHKPDMGRSRAGGLGALHRGALGVIAALVLLAGLLVAGCPVLAASPSFDAPAASGSLGSPLQFSTTFHSAQQPQRIELLKQLKDQPGTVLQAAAVTPGKDAGTWSASLTEGGHILPNSTFDYWFQAVLADGTTVEGPHATFTVADEHFQWRSLQGRTVTLHWYSGDQAFAQRALDIGDQAIDQAAQLLGVEKVRPVDFFIYDSEAPFRDALGPGTRENVGGQANADIRTMFGLIEPSDVNSDWVRILVTHELTHVVFADAVNNPYHYPPRWLNEGLAVYLSQGYVDSDRAAVADAARSGTIIPLDGIAGLFPTTRDRFSLAYAESVSAVDYFITTYGKDTLVRLIQSYAGGVTDDEAFKAATGSDFRAFDDAWLVAQGAARPEPVGPQPAPPGPIPSGWSTPAP
jgi:hypothetical protein